jgi:CHAT domain-containing protein/tetratricopeptide (TPR) repeat protein
MSALKAFSLEPAGASTQISAVFADHRSIVCRVLEHLTVGDATSRTFIIEDYETCLMIVGGSLPGTTIANIQFYLISLQRLDQDRLIDHFEANYPQGFELSAWENSLICLTLGKEDPETALDSAADPEQVCAASYYAAERCITFGDTGRARTYFEQCIATGVDSLEHQIAAIRLRKMNEEPPAYPRPRHVLLGKLRLLEHLRAANELGPAGRVARDLEASAAALDADDPAKLRMLISIGSAYIAVNDFLAAVPALEAALNQLLRTDDLAGSPLHDNVQHAYGQALARAGRLADAIPVLEEVVELRRSIFGESHQLCGRALLDLASVHVSLNNIEIGRDLIADALNVIPKGHNDDYASALNTLSAIYAKLGDNRFSPALFNISAVVLGDGTFSEQLLREAIDTYRAIGNIESYHAALHNLAALKRRKGEPAEAAALLKSIARERGGTAITSELDISVYTGLADALVSEGHYEEALTYATAAWDAAPRIIGRTHQRLVTIAQMIAFTAIAAGHNDEAGQALRGLVTQLDAMLREVAIGASARGRIRSLELIHMAADFALSLVSGRIGQIPGSAEIIGSILLSFKSVEARLAAFRLSSESADAREAVNEIIRLAEHQHDLEMTGLERGEEGWLRFLAARDHLKELQDRAELRLSRLLDASRMAVIDPQAVVSALPPGCALVEFGRSGRLDFNTEGGMPENRSGYVVVVMFSEPGAAPLALDIGPAEAIDENIHAFRKALGVDLPGRAMQQSVQVTASGSDADLLTSLGIALRQRIFDPLLPHLGSCRNLLIVPDGEISSLPFEILPAADGAYLIDTYSFSYLGSGTEVIRNEELPPGVLGPCVVIAAPDYDLGSGIKVPPTEGEDASLREALSAQHFEPLPETEEEGRRVAELLAVQPWLGAEALKTRVYEVQRPKYLHIATHGYYLPNEYSEFFEQMGMVSLGAAEDLIMGRFEGARLSDPFLRSGLALAGANVWLGFGTPPDEAGNGLLTADDVMRMHLSGTELVVLSACETGIGHVGNLEGITGLRRAFTVAGAHTMIVSLWMVADLPTRELFVDFYQRLLGGEPSVLALRSARLALRERYPHPLHWGSFVHQGFVPLMPDTT